MNKTYTDEYLISELNRFVVEYGHHPTWSEMESAYGYPDPKTYQNRFGSWSDAKEIAGLSRYTVGNYMNTPCSICKTEDSVGDWYKYDDDFICAACHTRLWKYEKKGYGYKPLNDYFDGSHCHHLHIGDDHDICVYIPSDIHTSIGHNSVTGDGMNEINIAALNWLYTEKQNGEC
jgi:hypothetical protein